MSPERERLAQAFTAWRTRNFDTQIAAGEALERGRRTIQEYERGEKDIPLYVRLAASAIELQPATLDLLNAIIERCDDDTRALLADELADVAIALTGAHELETGGAAPPTGQQ